MTRVSVGFAAWVLLGCGSAGAAPTPPRDVEILPAPSGSVAPRPSLDSPGETRRRSERGRWYANEDEAVALAREEKRPLVVDFVATWCLACKELETKTYPGVSRALDRFVLLRIDATDEEEPNVRLLLERYKVLGLPTVLLLDERGNEVGRFDRFVDAEAMREALERVP